jgi:hypothetical protein
MAREMRGQREGRKECHTGSTVQPAVSPLQVGTAPATMYTCLVPSVLKMLVSYCASQDGKWGEMYPKISPFPPQLLK